MWEAAVVEDAIQAHPQAAEAALAQVRLTFETVPDIHGLRAAADYLELPLHEVWAQTLERKEALDAFAAALSAQGVSLGEQVLAFDDTHWDIRRTPEFFSRAEVFRCRVLADGAPSGSGILVGPSTVLTAWHVVAVAAPDEPQEPARRVQVEVAGGRRIEAAAPWRFESYCGSLEYQKRLPKTDAEVDNRHDLALLSLREPVGLHSGFATLPPQPYDYHGPAAMAVVHFPEGEDHGIGMGRLRKLPGLTARWGHDVQTAGGSSGGGCFDTRYQLIGIHQGRAGRGGRLVPAVRFPAAVIQAIAEDEAPPTLWSLDGTLGTSLVVGRDMLFQAYAAARRDGRARGLWVKRIDTVNDVSGLPFTYELLSVLAGRSPAVRLVRISLDAVVEDLPDEIARRLTAAGIPVSPQTPVPGVAPEHAQEEGAIADRGRRVALAADEAAARLEGQVWVYFDHPAVAFADPPRWALAAFVDQVLRSANLRVVLAGYELLQMPGEAFETPPPPGSAGGRGLVVEYLSGFRRGDVEALVERAASGMGKTLSPERVDELTDEAIEGLREVGGVYDAWQGAAVSDRLRARLA